MQFTASVLALVATLVASASGEAHSTGITSMFRDHMNQNALMQAEYKKKYPKGYSSDYAYTDDQGKWVKKCRWKKRCPKYKYRGGYGRNLLELENEGEWSKQYKCERVKKCRKVWVPYVKKTYPSYLQAQDDEDDFDYGEDFDYPDPDEDEDDDDDDEEDDDEEDDDEDDDLIEMFYKKVYPKNYPSDYAYSTDHGKWVKKCRWKKRCPKYRGGYGRNLLEVEEDEDYSYGKNNNKKKKKKKVTYKKKKYGCERVKKCRKVWVPYVKKDYDYPKHESPSYLQAQYDEDDFDYGEDFDYPNPDEDEDDDDDAELLQMGYRKKYPKGYPSDYVYSADQGKWVKKCRWVSKCHNPKPHGHYLMQVDNDQGWCERFKKCRRVWRPFKQTYQQNKYY